MHQKSNGFKTLSYQLPREYNEHLFRTLRDSDKLILLHRKNLLQAAVSTHISLQTDLWLGAEHIQQAVKRDGLKPINTEKLKKTIEELKEVSTHYKNFLAELKQPYLELTYEDLYSSPRKHRRNLVANIFEFLELSLPSRSSIKQIDILLSPKRKINSIETYKHIPNLNEIVEKFSGKENGYLF